MFNQKNQQSTVSSSSFSPSSSFFQLVSINEEVALSASASFSILRGE